MLTVLFEMVDAHARIIIPFRRRAAGRRRSEET
jgi:hypothetical protein